MIIVVTMGSLSQFDLRILIRLITLIEVCQCYMLHLLRSIKMSASTHSALYAIINQYLTGYIIHLLAAFSSAFNVRSERLVTPTKDLHNSKYE